MPELSLRRSARRGTIAGLTFGAGFWAGVLFLSSLDKVIPQKGRTR